MERGVDYERLGGWFNDVGGVLDGDDLANLRQALNIHVAGLRALLETAKAL